MARDSGGAQRLYLRAIDALEPRVVPGSEDGSAPAFSPDGSALAFLANGELRKVRLSDGITAVLARVQAGLRSSSGNTLVRWAAPERLVVTSGGRLSTVSANGGVVTPVPTNDTLMRQGMLLPFALPDGQRVLYRSNRGGTLRLWSQPVSGGDSRLELERPGKDIWEGQYSPDGRYLVFRTGTLSTADIWVTPSTGKGPDLPVATSPAQENSARVSPDGKWVLYTSLQNGNPEVFVARFPAMTDRLQVSSGGGSGAMWGDSRTIYYRASWQLVTRVTLNTDGAPSVVRREDAVRREMITAAGPAMMDIAPDKKRLLVLVPSEQGTTMVVAVGWQHELRRLLARTARD